MIPTDEKGQHENIQAARK